MCNGSRYTRQVWAKLAPGRAEPRSCASACSATWGRRRRSTPSSATRPSPPTRGCGSARPTTWRSPTESLIALRRVGERHGSPSTSTTSDLTFVPPAVVERDIPSVERGAGSTFFPVGAAVRPGDLPGEHGVPPLEALQQPHLGERHEVGHDRADAKGPSPSRTPTRRWLREGQQHGGPRSHAGLARPEPGVGVQRR